MLKLLDNLQPNFHNIYGIFVKLVFSPLHGFNRDEMGCEVKGGERERRSLVFFFKLIVICVDIVPEVCFL